MDKGTIKWFSPRIGAGFIRSEAGRNVFFNYRAILDYHEEIICTGQHVNFDIVKNGRNDSLSAARVRFVNPVMGQVRHRADDVAGRSAA